MPTSYTSNLRLALPTTGELSGTWGDTVNNSITSLLDDAVGGYVAVTITPTANKQALTAVDGAADQARNAVLKLNAGTVSAAFELYAPPTERTYVVWNNSGYSCTLYVATVAGGTTAAGLGVVIPNTAKMTVYLDGTNVVEQVNYMTNLALSSALPVTSGGTGVTTSTGSGSNVLSTSPTLVTPILGTPTSGTLTNATGLPLTTGVTGTLAATNGGTGQTSYAVGDVLFASTTTALSKLADVATGNAIISGGVGVAPSYGKIGLTTHVSGTLPVANGGTNLTSIAALSVPVANTANTYTTVTPTASQSIRINSGGTAWEAYTPAAGGVGTVTSVAATVPSVLSISGSPITTSGTLAISYSGTALPVLNGGTGQTTVQAAINSLAGATTSGQYLRGNGTNVVMAAIQTADVPTLNQNTTGTAAGLSTALVATSGGTGQTSYAVGDLLFASTTTALSKLADVATGSAVISGGVGVAPSYGKIGLTTHVSGTLPVANGGTNLTSIAALSVPVANTANTYTTVTPAAGQSIRINAGNTAWEAYAPATGTVTGVTGTAPIVSSGGAAPAISISAATTGAAGSMSAADKTKLDGVATGATANTGTVTSASVVTANGFAGTVATATTTPAITLTTSITGVLKGNGTAISAASAGTDYVTPTGTETLSAKTLTTPTVNGYTEGVVTANTTTAYTISITTASVQILTLTGNCTYTFPTVAAGKSFLLVQRQDGTGGRTVTWPSVTNPVRWPSGVAPTITSTASRSDLLAFTSDGTVWYGRVIALNYT